MREAKPYEIPKKVILEAYKRVKANRGAAGVDKETLGAFEADLEGNLYKIWNRMSSGSYFPPPVRLVEIPKKDGGTRPLGIPTVADRVAQGAARMYLEEAVEWKFHPDSYAYRRNQSALAAVAKARERIYTKGWVVDLDIKGFFDNLDHDLLLRAVRFHTELPWLRLYIERWLKAPLQDRDGVIRARERGVPQGGVISPVLANLYLHHAFDDWMKRHLPGVEFERYADDIIIHCEDEKQARHVLERVRERMRECRLELHPVKTRIVHCPRSSRRAQSENVTFDFLGFTFRPRPARSRDGRVFQGFLPAIAKAAAKKIRETVRSWLLSGARSTRSLEDLAELINPVVRGWANYYGRFYWSECANVLQFINKALARWARRKLKRFKRSLPRARRWLQRVAHRQPGLFHHWEVGVLPQARVGRAG